MVPGKRTEYVELPETEGNEAASEKQTSSLTRVLAVLDLFSEDRLEWMPDEMMAELGYTRPTLYRYLKTLKEAGLLSSLPNAGFTLGPRIVEFDYLLRRSDPLILHGTTHLRDLAARYECTALFARWHGNRILCVESVSSTDRPLSSYSRGRPMPLGRGAISRSIIAFLPRRRQQVVIEENLADLRSVGLGETVAEVQESLRRVRATGYAVGFGEVTPGMVGIGAPIFDARRNPIASLCVTIAGNLVDGRPIDEIGAQVQARANAVTQALAEHRA